MEGERSLKVPYLFPLIALAAAAFTIATVTTVLWLTAIVVTTLVKTVDKSIIPLLYCITAFSLLRLFIDNQSTLQSVSLTMASANNGHGQQSGQQAGPSLVPSQMSPGLSGNQVQSIQLQMQFPMVGMAGSPYFDGSDVTEFLDRWDDLVAECGISHEHSLRRLPQYCTPLIKENLRSMPEYESGDWMEFKEMMKREYRDRDDYQRLRSRPFLEQLAAASRTSYADMQAYCRQFQYSSAALRKAGRLDSYTCNTLFLRGLGERVAERVCSRLKMSDDELGTVRFEDLFDAAMSICRQTKVMDTIRGPSAEEKSRCSEIVEIASRPERVISRETPFSTVPVKAEYQHRVSASPVRAERLEAGDMTNQQTVQPTVQSTVQPTVQPTVSHLPTSRNQQQPVVQSVAQPITPPVASSVARAEVQPTRQSRPPVQFSRQQPTWSDSVYDTPMPDAPSEPVHTIEDLSRELSELRIAHATMVGERDSLRRMVDTNMNGRPTTSSSAPTQSSRPVQDRQEGRLYQPKADTGSSRPRFCYACGVEGHIQPNCFELNGLIQHGEVHRNDQGRICWGRSGEGGAEVTRAQGVTLMQAIRDGISQKYRNEGRYQGVPGRSVSTNNAVVQFEIESDEDSEDGLFVGDTHVDQGKGRHEDATHRKWEERRHREKDLPLVNMVSGPLMRKAEQQVDFDMTDAPNLRADDRAKGQHRRQGDKEQGRPPMDEQRPRRLSDAVQRPDSVAGLLSKTLETTVDSITLKDILTHCPDLRKAFFRKLPEDVSIDKYDKPVHVGSSNQATFKGKVGRTQKDMTVNAMTTRERDDRLSRKCSYPTVCVNKSSFEVLYDGGSECNVMDLAVAQKLNLAIRDISHVFMKDPNGGRKPFYGWVSDTKMTIGGVVNYVDFLIKEDHNVDATLGRPWMDGCMTAWRRVDQDADDLQVVDMESGDTAWVRVPRKWTANLDRSLKE